MSDKTFYFIASGAIVAPSRAKAQAELFHALGNGMIMDFTVEGLREIKGQDDIDAVNRAVCKDCIREAVTSDRSKRRKS